MSSGSPPPHLSQVGQDCGPGPIGGDGHGDNHRHVPDLRSLRLVLDGSRDRAEEGGRGGRPRPERRRPAAPLATGFLRQGVKLTKINKIITFPRNCPQTGHQKMGNKYQQNNKPHNRLSAELQLGRESMLVSQKGHEIKPMTAAVFMLL